VGGAGQGTLNVTGGGHVTTIGTVIGDEASSNGTVIVSGSGSAWDVGANGAWVGNAGQGTLNVMAGGHATSSATTVGRQAGSVGTVLVSGTGSRWTMTGALSIGTGGAGTVKVANNGLVSAGSLTVGPKGTLDIDPATVNVQGDFTLLPGGTLSIGVEGAPPGLFSQLLIGGFGLFQGNIFVNFLNGFAPSAGQTFALIAAAGGADFSQASVEIGGLAPGFQFTSGFANGTWTFTALTDAAPTSTPEPASLGLLVGGVSVLVGVARRRARSATSCTAQVRLHT
jgi:T5SS/PEP-CTERM-associated repeat protein